MYERKSIIATNLETGEERTFSCTTAAAKALHMDRKSIWNVCRGSRSSACGYTFRYTDSKTLDPYDAEIIVAMADCDLNMTEAAKKMYSTRNTVWNHANWIKKQTGKDPRNFYDMCELLPMARAVLEGKQCL